MEGCKQGRRWIGRLGGEGRWALGVRRGERHTRACLVRVGAWEKWVWGGLSSGWEGSVCMGLELCGEASGAWGQIFIKVMVSFHFVNDNQLTKCKWGTQGPSVGVCHDRDPRANQRQ